MSERKVSAFKLIFTRSDATGGSNGVREFAPQQRLQLRHFFTGSLGGIGLLFLKF